MVYIRSSPSSSSILVLFSSLELLERSEDEGPRPAHGQEGTKKCRKCPEKKCHTLGPNSADFYTSLSHLTAVQKLQLQQRFSFGRSVIAYSAAPAQKSKLRLHRLFPRETMPPPPPFALLALEEEEEEG